MRARGEMLEVIDYWRPNNRSECLEMYALVCMFHVGTIYISTSIQKRAPSSSDLPDKEVWELGESCALDVAERGGITLEEVGHIMNLTRERS